MAKAIHQDFPDRFFSRFLSTRERYTSSKQGGEASFRVLYYGGTAGSVPFLWESCPGTPKKQAFSDGDLPPLTPPPSLLPATPTKPASGKKHDSAGFKFLNSILPRLTSRKINASPSGSALAAAAAPSSAKQFRWRRRFGRGCEVGVRSLCFGPGSRSPAKRMKKMVQKIVGHSDFI